MTGDWYEEHEVDPLDTADSYALLDGGQILAPVEPIDWELEDGMDDLERRQKRNRTTRWGNTNG